MAPSSYIDINAGERRQLLDIARQSIKTGLSDGQALRLNTADFDGFLVASLGVFVTLTRDESLRGCMGALQSADPLAQTTAACAFNAAFKDPRFAQLDAGEAKHIRIEISILSEMVALDVSDRDNLLRQLQPGIDGLLMEDGQYRSTFLPKVWEKIDSPTDFLQHLMTKAGLPADYWSQTIQFSRYHTVSFTED
jgi:AmmeMemoRadiSam system protein A